MQGMGLICKEDLSPNRQAGRKKDKSTHVYDDRQGQEEQDNKQVDKQSNETKDKANKYKTTM